MIKGWQELFELTGMKYEILRRMIALYGFPRPEKRREGSIIFYIWNEAEVLTWLAGRRISEKNNLGRLGHDSTGR